jgi:hypothetical protein
MSKGQLTPTTGTACLFPSTVVFTETPTHKSFELFGARRHYRGLQAKKHSSGSFDLVVGGFDFDGPTTYMVGVQDPTLPTTCGVVIQNQAIIPATHLFELDRRFPGLRKLFGTQLLSMVSTDCFKAIDGQRIDNILIVDKCLLANSCGQIVRARYTNLLFAVSNSLSEQEVLGHLKNYVTERPDAAAGLSFVQAGEVEATIRAGQFTTMYLQGLKETTLTKFLEDQPEILEGALGAVKIFPQALLSYQEGRPSPKVEDIQPDFIVRRDDGTCFIVEFKLPLLNKDHVIRSKDGRRKRFVDTIADGIAQLQDYSDYFAIDANRKYAEQRLGERIADPNLVLVVGTSENVNLAEAQKLALRSSPPPLIMDYDTLTWMLLKQD